MNSLTRAAARLLLAASACLAAASVLADGKVGITLPADFPVPLDASLGDVAARFRRRRYGDAHAGRVRAR